MEELPDERIEKFKDECGKFNVLLNNDVIEIVIEDDGKGIDIELIKKNSRKNLFAI